MKIKDLAHNPENPRNISQAKLATLKKALAEFGDLSGIVYNRKTDRLVGGHQRSRVLDQNALITVSVKHSKPTKTGTVAEGYIQIGTDRHTYREVYWPEVKEKAANIAANKGAGVWDMPKLNEWLKDISKIKDFDVSLTMFDDLELSELPTPIEVVAHTRKSKGDTDEEAKQPGPSKCKAGEVYQLGTSYLKCGEDDLYYCDLILKRWTQHSGEEAVLVKSKLRKTNERAI